MLPQASLIWKLINEKQHRKECSQNLCQVSNELTTQAYSCKIKTVQGAAKQFPSNFPNIKKYFF